LKQWIKKLLTQFEIEKSDETSPDISEDRATLLYIIDTFSKHLIELESQPIRKARAIFDEFAKGLIYPSGPNTEKLLFRFRQFFTSYRMQEFTYLRQTFEDFKGIIWDFADQLNESVKTEQSRDKEVRESLSLLREAVESNSIDDLKIKSREFIDFYIELQTKNESARSERLQYVQKNLETVKKKLVEVKEDARRDHLTGSYNRKHFDEKIALLAQDFSSQHNQATQSAEVAQHTQNFAVKKISATLIMVDIDYFKKVNDIFGHDAGDFVLKKLVQMLTTKFCHSNEFVARLGGEEFAILISGQALSEVVTLAEEMLSAIRSEVLVFSDTQIRFTASMGAAQLLEGETVERWMKRADLALYSSKSNGRDQLTVSPENKDIGHAA
jgi:diguanylate cyclase (GGDEF)-like protein